MTRIKGLLVAIAVTAAMTAGVGAGTASASADGCTSAPGGLGALNCIYVNGSSDLVNYSDSIYNSGVNPSNVCNPQGKWKYKKLNTTAYAYKYVSASTCGLWRGYVTWNSPGRMVNQSQFCATQKNSVISSYANYACITIKK